MNYTGVEHKLKVFISSKCGGKYSVARKALKTLLEATGLIEASLSMTTYWMKTSVLTDCASLR